MLHRYLTALVLVASPLGSRTALAQVSSAGEGEKAVVESTSSVSLFPRGDPFRPVIADPRERGFFASLVSERSPSRGSPTGSVGMGASVGIVRWNGTRDGDGLQVGLSGGVFAQFDLSKKSHDLINADYLVGIPVSYRHRAFSARFRVYHQSSHLGDEFVENNEAERLNLSFESFELLMARDFGPVRSYAGGEYRINRTPRDEVKHGVLHGGIEYRHPQPVVRVGQLGGLRPVVAVDAQLFEQRDWGIGWSGRVGLELGGLSKASGAPSVSFLLEVYRGPNPYGQFYLEDISSLGFGAHFSY